MNEASANGRLVVRCACGWETHGSEDEVVAATDAHGVQLHNMKASREQILAMARPAAGVADPDRPATAPPATTS